MSQAPDATTLTGQLLAELRGTLDRRGVHAPRLIGIHTGGAWVAAELHRRLALDAAPGSLDIGFYRDDVSTRGVHPQVHPSRLPFEVDGADIVLVDDVLCSGRTVRAALNEIFDYGRPARVLLAVLVDRGEHDRQLPIAADAAGARVDLPAGQWLKLRGPDPLRLEVVEAPS